MRTITRMWLAETLDGLHLDRICLVGQSDGGWLALNFAIAALRSCAEARAAVSGRRLRADGRDSSACAGC